jgi:hypothetical protein
MQQVQNPYPGFVGLDGTPLELGKIYIGQENADPEVSPVSVYFDSGATQLASQPIRTIGGYPDQNGSPAQLWVTGKYSIRVRDSLGNQIFYVASAGGDDRPYHIHTQFLAASPAAQGYICIHVFGVGVSLSANLSGSVWAYVATPPSSNCNFDLRANGISFGTLTISTLGTVSVSSTAQSFNAGDRLTIVTPAGGTDLVNLGITIAGVLS